MKSVRRQLRSDLHWFQLFSLLLVMLLAGITCLAQSSAAELVGTITNATGEVVPQARVALRNTATGEVREFLTDASGNYIMTQLPPGAYQLTVESQGFKQFIRDGLVLQVGQRARVDAQLEVGALTEAVKVTAEAPLLDSTDASLGQAIENRKILDLPLNGRNIVALAALTPGVNPGTSFGIGNPDGRAALVQAASSNVQINGGLSAHNDVLLDGVPLSVCCQNQIAFLPSIDTTQEFRVRTSMYDAQFGRTSGGIISYASKSGANDWHGTLYEFHRNQALDANNFFSNRAGLGKTHFVYNQFGGAFGGRLLRDRTFFFGNFEGIRNRRGLFQTGRVPTADERRGIFREAIHDPLTTRREGATFVRTPFANNTIPQNRIDPVAAKLVELYPLPNATGVNNFVSNASTADTENQFTVRLDHQLTKNQRLFGRFSFNANDSVPPDTFGNIGSPGTTFTQKINNRNFVLDDTLTAGQSWVVSLRYGFTRQNNVRAPRSEGTDLTQFGWPASFSNARQATTLPKINPAGFLGLSTNALFRRAGEVHTFGASATKIQGNHTLKFGTDYRVYRTNWFDNNDAAGNFGFNTGFTRGPNAQTGGGGNSFASFLLGYPASGNITILQSFAAAQLYNGLFAQDDWRISNKLTVNLGLRWDVETGRSERYDRLSWFDPDAPSPLAAQVGIAGLRGGLRFLNVGDDIGRQQATDWKNFGPRAGLAWTPLAHFVVRAGYGMTYLPITSRYVNSSNQGFLTTTNFFSSVDGLTPVGKLNDPFPNGVQQPAGSKDGLLSSLGQTLGTLLYKDAVGYAQQWSLNLQYELASNLLIDAAYVGSKGTKLPAPLTLNQLDDKLLAQGNALLQQVPNPFQPFVASGALSGATTTRLQLLRPFPQFLGVTSQVVSLGSSSYHAFQFKVNKRLSAGFSLLAAYTNAKLISDTPAFLVGFLDPAPGFQNVYNRRADRAVDPQDIAQRLVISATWDLPLGRGKRWLNGAPFVIDALLGGWQFNGITTFQTGQPFVVGLAVPTTSGATRPNLLRSAKKSGRAQDRLNEWFDRSAFAAPGPFEFGAAPRTLPDVRSHGARNFDLSLFKNLAITESLRLQFRAEFFNAFNTPQFAVRSSSFGNSDFAVVTTQKNVPRDVQLALKLIF